METDAETTNNSDNFVIKATNVPLEFFQNRDVTKRYFRRFGKVKLLMFRPKRSTLLIEYANEDSMLNALEVAGEYQGHVFNVTRDTETAVKKKKLKRDPDPDWTDDPDVKAELHAMGAFGPPRSYDLRAEPMSVDPVETTPKTTQRRRKSTPAKPKITPKRRDGDNSELVSLIRQQALTVEEKFRILDARDKLIRIKMKKNITLAKATIGSCPDMCPEKERLMRETQHQVALYEQEDGGKAMNPRLAVKQYSRSSADQEAPLPQELRPVNVLQMTMGYLMHRIMGLCDSPDVNTAEWYHFLWDRTRGIRKDITQQELCCQGSVELVEQCARFHIFCSARLVAEDASVFDQKINTENLTKCLQTLKYMYHDLQLKRESCRNESEFRAYIILLNLNDGNFMWEVQNLREDIQQSKDVRFALEVHSALDKHNYVKFFKLVNSTTFLNACILMRYFVQVRISAIKTMLKSYSPRVSQTSLPVGYLTKILAFESTEACVDFLETYGLYTDVERLRVVLDKPSFAAPEYPYVLDRALRLVESKRKSSIGEVVCGRELPPKTYENHVPQNSFDSEGYLLYDEVDSEERKDEEKVERVDSPKPKESQPVEAPPSKNIFGSAKPVPDIFGEQASGFGNFTPSAAPIIFPSTKMEFSESVPPPTPPSQTQIQEANKALEEKRRRVEEESRRRKAEEEAERVKKAEEEAAERKMREQKMQEERRLRQLEEIKAMKMIEEQKQREQKRMEQERRKNNEIKAVVTKVVNELITAVDENVKQHKLAEIKTRRERKRLRQLVWKWREIARRKRKRKALDFNPLWCGARSVEEEASELRTKSQNLVLNSIKRYKRGVPLEINVRKTEEKVKIDLAELTYKLLTKRFLELDMKVAQELFWKVTVSLPDEFEYKYGLNHLERVLDDYIQWTKKGSTTVLVEQSKSIPTVTYCLERQKGVLVGSENHTHGFVFFADNFNDDLMKRIVENLQHFGVFVKVPIVLALQRYDETKSNLKALIHEGIISDYLILVDQFTSKNLINMLEEGLVFLSTRVEKSPPLELDTLKSFLTKYLCSDVWKRANSFAKWNSNYKNCLKNPNTVIYLYNDAMRRLKTICLDESYREHFKFPRIFKDFLRNEIPESLPCDYKYFPSFWDHATYLKHVGAVIDALRLPNFLDDWPPKDQTDLECGVSNFCKRAVKDHTKCFYKTVSVLLRNVDPDINFGDVKDVLWTEIIELLCAEKLKQTNFSLYGTGFVNQSIYNQLIVVYDVHALNEFIRSDWFYINHPIVKQKILQMLGEPAEPEVVEEPRDDDVDIDAIYAKVMGPRRQDAGTIRSEISGCKKMLTDLEETVLIHKKILEKSGDLLKTILGEM